MGLCLVLKPNLAKDDFGDAEFIFMFIFHLSLHDYPSSLTHKMFLINLFLNDSMGNFNSLK